ncbi:hypothetical protein N7499_008717 [Penicillium canescens]|nr:hypothetical protein N7499_008717 [Penicillium canescens]KAJ6159046.1 hypothetical protein N7485_011872 [Penicillium canescens]
MQAAGHHMPVQPRGRPRGRARKNATKPADRRHSYATHSSLVAVQQSLEHTPDYHLDSSVATALLEYMLLSARSLGIYSILPTIAEPSQPTDGNSEDRDADVVLIAGSILIPGLTYALLAIALELRYNSLPQSEIEHAHLNKDSLRTSSLAHIPNLSWQYQPHIPDAISLLFLSFTWCFDKDLCEISLRWNSLARVILTDVARNHAKEVPAVRRLEQRFVSLSTKQGNQRIRCAMGNN